MKPLFKFLLWLIGLSVFLLATAHFALRHLLNTPRFKAAATGFIERTTGRPADYGRIDYELFPFSLVVRDAALKEKDGAQEFASIRSFTAIVDFQNKEITSLRIERPTLRIVQRPDQTYNFSDLASPKPSAESPPPMPTGPEAPASEKPAGPPAPSFAIRLLEVEQARFDFVRVDAEGGEETFTLSNLDFTMRDFAADKPLRMEGRAAIGNSSSVQFEISGPAFAEFAGNPGAWPVDFRSKLAVRDFADVQAFLPPDTLPFQSLETTLSVAGALANQCHVLFNLKTSDATESHPVALELALSGDVSLPAPVAAHLLAGAPLPDGYRYDPPACVPPPGTISLGQNPALAVFLKHVQAKAGISISQAAYGQNRFGGGLSAVLRDGTMKVSPAKFSAYGGTIEAGGNVQLLECPLSYQLESLIADKLEIRQALAANSLGDIADVSGTLHLEASASGQAVSEPALRSLAVDAKMRVANLQTVGPGGSLMDQVWIQLDNPILFQLIPRLKSKVEQAQQRAATITTSHYDTATAVLVLRDGIATLSDARLALPDYRLDVAGTILPFDDRLELAAKLVVSPEETAVLTNGKDRSAFLPYEEGGLMIPFTIRGPLLDPRIRPDLDTLLKNALGGGTSGASGSVLDALSDSEREHVEKGLNILGSFLNP